ncbi:MAG TPA: glycosyltransferase [Candidatus Cloacimonetes bacterium]|nr:glycosyltransferase [Candidatus Cloacimonadota bacterium]
MKSLSLVVPVFNDEKVIQKFYQRLKPVIDSLTQNYEILFIDDGSEDNSFRILRSLQQKDENIKILKLSKNFGQANAITAGLDHARNDLIVVMDSDLQDRPEDITKMISCLKKNDVQMVIANWIHRDEPFWKKFISDCFVFFSNFLTNIKQPQHARVFRVFTKKALETVKKIPDKSGTILSRFYRAKIKYSTVALQRDKSCIRKSNYNWKKLFQLAFDRILPNLRIKILRVERSPKYVIEKIV